MYGKSISKQMEFYVQLIGQHIKITNQIKIKLKLTSQKNNIKTTTKTQPVQIATDNNINFLHVEK